MTLQDLTLRNARIGFLNFSGRETRYNRQGDRNFVVFVDPETAENLVANGWNVKNRPARDDSGDIEFYVPVAVSYKGRPPRVTLIGNISNNRTIITEETVQILDYADRLQVDLTITPYAWQVNGSSGVKAYLKTMYVTIVEDPLDLEYAETDLSDGVPF